MKTWRVAVEWSNEESTHVIGIGNNEREAAKHATRYLDGDRIASVEVLGEINIKEEAKAIVDLMKELECQEAEEVSLNALIFDDMPIKEALRQMSFEDIRDKHCIDW